VPRGSSRLLATALTVAVSLGVAVSSAAQNVPAPRPPSPRPAATIPAPVMAEDVFTNLQVLKGLTVNQFMEAMGFFTASVGGGCTFCHVDESNGNWAKYADDIARKRTARRMVTMVAGINKDGFGGRQVVTCYTCHRGGNRPLVTASLAALYGAATADEPDDVVASAPGTPPAEPILDRYIAAIGGSERLAKLTSFTAKGTYEGYGDPEKRPVDVYAKAPAQRTTVVHGSDGDSSSIYGNGAAWLAAPITERPVTVQALTAGDLDAARLEAELTFPARIKQTFTTWRVGLPSTIDDRDVQVVQGSRAGGALATLYFDKESGLLVRLVRYADSAVGRIPMQTDYADYREVSGVKLPFRWTSTWLDGRSTIELTDVRPNVTIAAARFARPAAPTARRAR
jgi:photosynthetic reaction center cytochrome c subunit